MHDRALIDTNVLVYAHDPSDPYKCATANEVLDLLVERDLGVVSTQVLGEFASVVTSKIPEPLSIDEAARQVYALMEVFDVLPVDSRTVAEALRGSGLHGLAYWDAQIWAAARLDHVPVVLSEDFEHDREIEGVRFADPFADAGGS